MNAYLTCTGAFLPGPPIDNTEIEAVLGLVEGKPSRLKARILKSNGIQTRHYAIDRTQRTTHSNVEMAVAAARKCLRWYTNLHTRGNTGAASILIMLDEFLRDDRAQVGNRILCMVPESGRFNTAYMHFTVVGARDGND